MQDKGFPLKFGLK